MRYRVTLFRLGQADVEAENLQEAEILAEKLPEEKICWIEKDGKINMVTLVEEMET